MDARARGGVPSVFTYPSGACKHQALATDRGRSDGRATVLPPPVEHGCYG